MSNTIGETDNNFNENCRTVRNKVAGMGLKARVPAFIQDKALRQSSPYDTYYDDITKISNKELRSIIFRIAILWKWTCRCGGILSRN